MAGNQSAWRNRPVDLTKNTLSDGRDLSSGRKKDDEEKKKKEKATVTYNRPVIGQDPAERPEGTATVTGVNSRAEAIEAYRADREKTQEKARQEYKNAIRQYQLKTGKTVDSPNAVTAEDRMWYRASNPTDTTLSDTTRRIVEARRNTKQKKQELAEYEQEHKANRADDWKNAYQKAQAETSAATPMEGISDEDALIQQIQDTNRKARQNYNQELNEKKAAVSQAEKAQNQATMESGLDSISRLSLEGQKKLDEYNYRKDTASDPLATGLPELEAWFAENEHLDAEGLEKLAEVRRRETNAQKAAEQQQAAQEAADKHPIWNSALTVPANLIGGSMASLGYLGEALNGTGQFTDLDPYNQGTQLQNWSGAVRGEVKQNIVGDGSNPLRAIAGGAYDVGMGMADTGARIALGAATGGGSWLGAGIAGANNFGSAMQSAANRGANADQALLYATASATVDALTEKIPLDNLISISTAKGGAGYILNFLRSMGIEGGQEAASQLASLFADAAIMRDKSERNLEVAQMMTMNPDMSLEEAQGIVDRGTVNDILYSMIVSGLAGGFNSLVATTKYKLANRGENADVPEAGAQNPQEQPAQEAAEAPDSEKAAPLDGEQMARALAGQEQPARAGDLLAESEAEFDKAFDRVMNEESQKPTPESQPEAPKTDTEMDRRAKMALGMEDGQGSAEPAAEQKNAAGSGGVWNKLRSYSQEQIENWKSSKRIVLCDSIDQFKQFVKNALSGEEKTNKKMYFGAIGDELASDISKSTGLDVDGYNLTLGEDEIRKIKKSHGDESKEAPRGQRAVTEADYIAIPDIVQNADSIKRSDSDYNGKPAIEFRKVNGNETTTVVAVVSDKRLDVFVQTEYVNKKAGSIATPESVQADSFTSETPGGTAPSSEATSAGGAASNTTIQQNVSEVNRLSDSAQAADSQGMSAQDGQPTAQNAQEQPQAQNTQPVQQQATPKEMPQEAQGGAQMAETSGQAQTPGGYVPGAQASAEGKTMKSKSFTNSGLRGTDNDIRESYKGTLAVDPKAGDYQQLRNMDVLDVARERTSTPERLEAEYDYLMKKENLTATDVATTALATKEFFRNGDVDQYVDLNLHKAKTATEAGQVIQAFNIGGTMKDAADPETACETAIKGLSKLNKEMTTYNADKSGKSFEDWRKDVSMDITRLAIAVESVEDGDTAGMQKVITQIAQARNTTGWLGSSDKLTWNARRILKKLDFDDLKKIANTQIASMPDDFRRRTNREVTMGIRKQNILTSIKSFGRNIGGNATTGLLDSASDSLGGQAMDMLISKFTGKRTTGNDFTHTKAYIDGAKSAADFASLCVELNIPIETDVDASYSAVSSGNRMKYGGKTFRSTGNLGMRLLYGYQKYMNYALEVTDKVFEGGSNAAVAESLEGLRNSGLGDGDIERLSEFTANRRTFKDATWEATDKYGDTKEHGSALARYGKKVKKGLSGDGALGAAGEFAADSAMPFVGTTMNVTQTGVDYSTGVMKSLGELASLIHDAKQGKTIDVNRQRQVASDFGRGVSGLALIGGFTALAAKGIIRVSNADDKNKKALEQADGLSGAQINWSAAARESTGGDTKWQAGDVISSLDSLEPFNTHMYLGAELAQEDDIQGMLKALPGATAKSVFQAFMDSPMVTGLQNITDMVSDISEAVEKGDTEAVLGAAAKYAGETASSFIPQIVKQGAKAADGYYRDTRGQTAAEYAKNAFLTNVPGGGQDLPKKISGLGEEQKRGGIYANLFDTTNSQIYQPNAITESLGELSDATGGQYDKEIYPERQAPMQVKNAAGEAVELDGAQRETYQMEYGGKVSEYYSALMKNPDYQKLTDELKAEALKTVKGYAADYARAAVTDYKEVKTGTAEEIGKEAVMDVVTKQMASGINDMQKVWDYGYDEKPAKETLESAYDTYSKMTDSQKAAYRESVSGDTARYLEAREAGVSTTAYLKVLDAVKHADGTGNSAKYRAITSASISDSAMDKLMKAYMPDYDPDNPKSDKTELKYDYARKELGMTPAQYAQAYEIYTSKSDDLHYKKQKMAKWTELYGADMAKKLWKLYGGKLDVVDWWEEQQ